MKRKLLLTGITLLLVVGVVALIGKQLLVGYLTPDFLVRQIENRWNCRAHIDSVKVSLVGTTGIELVGVALAPRDRFADDRVPLGERDALAEGVAQLWSDSVLLEIRPGKLVQRQLDIQQLVFTRLAVETSINRDGDATLEPLFDSPSAPVQSVALIDEPDASEGPTLALAQVGADSGESLPEEEDEFDAGDLKFSAVADSIEIKEGMAILHIESSGATLRLESLEFSLTDIDVDPQALGSHNRALGQFTTDLMVVPPKEGDAGDSSDEARYYLKSHLSGSGKIRPFNPETGKIDAVWSADLTVHEGAEINTFPVVAKLQEMLAKVDTAGVDLSDLNIRGTLLADTETQIGHAQGKYLLKKPLNLLLPDTEITLEDGSWFHSGTNEHRMKGRLLASEALTSGIESKVDAYLQEKTGGLASPSIRSLVLSPLIQDGRLAIEFSSRGDLSKPKVDIVTPFGNLSDLIDSSKNSLKGLEEVGKGLLQNFLGK